MSAVVIKCFCSFCWEFLYGRAASTTSALALASLVAAKYPIPPCLLEKRHLLCICVVSFQPTIEYASGIRNCSGKISTVSLWGENIFRQNDGRTQWNEQTIEAELLVLASYIHCEVYRCALNIHQKDKVKCAWRPGIGSRCVVHNNNNNNHLETPSTDGKPISWSKYTAK